MDAESGEVTEKTIICDVQEEASQKQKDCEEVKRREILRTVSVVVLLERFLLDIVH